MRINGYTYEAAPEKSYPCSQLIEDKSIPLTQRGAYSQRIAAYIFAKQLAKKDAPSVKSTFVLNTDRSCSWDFKPEVPQDYRFMHFMEVWRVNSTVFVREWCCYD